MRKYLFVFLIVCSIAALGWVVLRSRLPDVFNDYERGYGDTILRYKDRTYEGAKWENLKESKSLHSLASVGYDSTIGFHAITGWDDSNFWVTTQGGRIYRQRDGAWQTPGKPEYAGEAAIRCIDRDTLLVAGVGNVADHWYQIDLRGITDFGEVGYSNRSKHTEICPVANDLLFCFRSEYLNHYGTIRLSQGQRTDMPEDKFKEAFVHRSDNTPIKEHPVRGIRFSRTFRPGCAFAISESSLSFDNYTLVQFRDGIWYKILDLGRHNLQAVQAVWMTGSSEDLGVVLAGPEGWVEVHEVGKSKIVQPLATSAFPTSQDLIAVWGVSTAKYWVMDTNGTVWERSGTESRVVVRGLRQDNVKFRGAWVSPTGTVLAITDDLLYRLN